MKQLLFASLNLPSLDCEKLVFGLKKLPESAWFYDQYRNTFMAPMLSRGGSTSFKEVKNINTEKKYAWTPLAPPVLKEYFQHFIFNWMDPLPRIMILKTEPHKANQEHIDCTPAEFHSMQPKFRYVLQGNVDDLYFLTKSNKVYAPKTKKPFIMNGAWPHGMLNRSQEVKYTLCAGAPWMGAQTYPEFEQTLSISKDDLPQDYARYFEADPVIQR